MDLLTGGVISLLGVGFIYNAKKKKLGRKGRRMARLIGEKATNWFNGIAGVVLLVLGITFMI